MGEGLQAREGGTHETVGAAETVDVLAVGIDPGAATLLRSRLRERDEFHIHACASYDEAELEALRLHPHVITLDPGSEPSPAWDVLARLAHRSETAPVPVIVLARTGQENWRDAAFARGASDFLDASAGRDELSSRLCQHAERYRDLLRRNDAVASTARLQRQLRDRTLQLDEANRVIDTLRRSLALDARTGRGRLEAMLHVAVDLYRIQDFHTLMDRILTEARHLIHAEAGTIFIREGPGLRFAYTQNDPLARRTRGGTVPRFSSFVLPVTEQSIAGWVSSSGETVIVEDAYRLDPSLPFRFDRSFDARTGYRTRSVLAMPLRTSLGRTLGVLELLNALEESGRPRPRFSEEDRELLEHFAALATVAIERAQLTESMLLRLLRMAQVRDPCEDRGHVERVAGYAVTLFEEWARRRGFDGPAFERQRDRLRLAAKLHDVGKVAVPEDVLRKPGPLTEQEISLVRQHVLVAARLFAEQPTEFDDAARDVVLNHHERWDGSGYPGFVDLDGRALLDPATGKPRAGGRRGEEIPLFARIVALAETFDALTCARPWRSAMPEPEAVSTIRQGAGKQFDPELVDILLTQLERLGQVREQVAQELTEPEPLQE